MNAHRPLMARIAAVVALPLTMAVGLTVAPTAQASQPAAAPAVAPNVVVISAAATYNLAALASHNTASSCWVAISTSVYDLTPFLTIHSGGSSKITPVCGKDGTSTFTGKHGTVGSASYTSHANTLAPYIIGTYDNTAPTAPTALGATAGDTQVSLSWTGPADAVSYQVFQGATQVGTPTGASYVATGLTNGTAYSFTVKAVDAAGNVSAASSAVSSTPVGAVPSAPTGLAATPGNAQVALTWTATAGATSYQVFQGATQIATPATNSYTATGLTNGTLYSFTVKAVNGSGTSGASTAATATPMPPIPGTPTGLSATPGNAQVALTWTATAGATSYQVFQGATQIATPATNSYTATGLTNGTLYSFTVKAVNMSGASGASTAATATPVVPGSAPSAPTGLAATAGDARVDLTWNATSGATSYQVFRGATLLGTTATPSYAATGLTNGTLYSFTVTAVNGIGTSPASSAVTATPVAIPATPTGLAAVPTSAQVALTWNATAGATSYQVFQGATQIATPATNSYTVTGLTNGTAYAFTVKAVNASGTSGASGSVSATPVAVPAAPSGLTATAGSAQVALSWSSSAGATTYQVFRGATLVASPVTTSYTVTGLTDGTAYSFTVKAANASGTSAASSAATATPVAVPTGLTATPGNTQVTLSWSPAAGATTYEVYQGATLLVTQAETTFPVTGLTNGVAVSFTVKALNATGASDATSPVTATPALPTGGYTSAQLATHKTVSDCWVAIAGQVYDLTTFLGSHSGGSAVISGVCGGDGTTTFYTRHGATAVGKLGTLSVYLKGALADYVAAPLPQQAASPTVDAVVGGGSYTMDEVKAHNTAADCWTVIGDGVFGLSTWIPVHPGGASVVAAMCGIDSTAMYSGKHGGSGSANAILAKIRMGTLVASKPKPVTTYAATDVTAHKTAADCWSIVNGTMYDLTAWIGKHPGGPDVIVAMCGIDGSAMYNGKHGSNAGATAALDAYKLGAVEGTLPATSDASTVAASGPIVKVISAQRVRAHDDAQDCWTIVNRNVYNLTPWTKRHPNRTAFIQEMCGKNGSAAYNKTTGSVAKSNKALKRFLIGRVGRPTSSVPATTPAATSQTYTLADVAGHKTATSCWSVVNGGVYDLTKWIPLHPGGAGVITAMCGKDASTSYNSMHKGSAKAAAALAQYAIGKLG